MINYILFFILLNNTLCMGNDKLAHFSGSLILTFSIGSFLYNKENISQPVSMVSSTAIVFNLGFLKEIRDSKKKKNIFDNKDILANSIGIILANIGFVLAKKHGFI